MSFCQKKLYTLCNMVVINIFLQYLSKTAQPKSRSKIQSDWEFYTNLFCYAVRTSAADLDDSAISTHRFLLFSYLDFCICFACYPPESFKIICLTLIWLKFVDTLSFHSSQKPPHPPWDRQFSQFFEKSMCEAQNTIGAGTRLNLLTSPGPNLESIGSNAIFCQLFFLIVRFRRIFIRREDFGLQNSRVMNGFKLR